nr:hypothetical protein [Kibdelosporangium sp. MJ126-NF4]CEL22521.1 hypothetical protein [Kibdelosporangium sp. MJ126-NF4]CTQ89377.1 hypothetical protein [Kibdelosporangium sp. MJ126-NF4]
MSERRHLLVVASQCAQAHPLPLLDKAARALHGVLVDPELGGCLPGLPDGCSLRLGSVPIEQVRRDIQAAVRHAGERGATLVLAFLGHGFVPGSAADLHMMASDSVEDDATSATSVAALIAEAADRIGTNGVIGIVDTCSAAGALPALDRLLVGSRSGRTRVALLMASAVRQEAFEFRLATGLAEILHDGVAGARKRLDVHTALEELRQSGNGHQVVKFDYDGDPLAPDTLWLGHNRRHHPGRAPSTTGRAGRAELRQVLGELPACRTKPVHWHVSELRELTAELATLPNTPTANRALQIADSLLVAARTTELLHTWIPDFLGTSQLRQAIATACVASSGGGVSTNDDVADVVERLALFHPATNGDCRDQMSRFVVALAAAAGKQPNAKEIRAWAQSIGANRQVGDAVNWVAELSRARRLRLVLSLHASITGTWPDALETWLLLDGKLDSRARIPCAADRTGVEAAMVTAIDQAEVRADDLGLELEQVDIAVPTKLLLDWHPEKIVRGEWLGVHFHLVTRWSERLNPANTTRWMTTSAARRLRTIAKHAGAAPVDWLTGGDVEDLPKLRGQLVQGRYPRAIALCNHPGDSEGLLALLLAHIPIVFWPQTGQEFPRSHRGCLDTCWHLMPGELIEAYRRAWSDDTDEPMAGLRVVWDDHEWLDFCKTYQRRTK